MKIEITRRVGGHDAGTTLDIHKSQANHLIANGYAIEAKSATAKPKVGSARTVRKTDRDGASDTAEGV